MPGRAVVLRRREIIRENGGIVLHVRHPGSYFNSLLVFFDKSA
jgi:hypothetical protein